MQQSAAQQISQFEQQRIQMQYEFARMQFDMNNLGRQRSGSSIICSIVREAPHTAYRGVMTCSLSGETS